jgi:hypothetical protein
MAKTKKLTAPVRNFKPVIHHMYATQESEKTYTQQITKVSGSPHNRLNIFISSQPTRNNGSKHISYE